MFYPFSCFLLFVVVTVNRSVSVGDDSLGQTDFGTKILTGSIPPEHETLLGQQKGVRNPDTTVTYFLLLELEF